MAPVRRRPVSLIVVLAVCGLVSVACGSTKVRSTASSCGPGYVFTAEGHRSAPLDCGLLVPETTSKFVTVGERFSIAIARDSNGQLILPIPQPKPHGPVRLTHRVGYRVFYVATHPGIARLWAHHTHFCPNLDPKLGSCVVYSITVARAVPLSSVLGSG